MSTVPEDVKLGCWIPCCRYRQLRAAQHGCWELNLSPLQDQYILLTTVPSFQPLVEDLISYIYFRIIFEVD